MLLLLAHDAISIRTFFEKLGIDSHQEQANKASATFEEIIRTNYASNSLTQIRKTKAKAVKLDIEADMKKDVPLIIDGVLESGKDGPETFDINLRDQLKEKIFLMPEYNTYKSSAYANFIDLYDFDSNQQIIRQVVRALKEKKVERQDEILFAIILNVLEQGVEEKKYNEANKLASLGQQIKVIPEFFLYREMLTFYEELTTYHTDRKVGHLKRCKLILKSFGWGGISAFGKEMIKFLDKYKEQQTKKRPSI